MHLLLMVIKMSNGPINDKDAVKVAKWFGHYVKYGFGFKVPGNPSTEVVDWYMEWLNSPEGLETIRTMVQCKGCGIYEETGLTIISWPDDTSKGANLIEAVLAMINTNN